MSTDKWKVEPVGATATHVYPLNDLREHELNNSCWCVPAVDEFEVCVHNSLDKREEFENGRKMS